MYGQYVFDERLSLHCSCDELLPKEKWEGLNGRNENNLLLKFIY